ncbi:TRIC cation channel family protein [Bifidobacterium sp. ESL0784]|uniref:trimeric intracellular cation channel family protein n=1 Tax=Bifidobacterium sp. ESL0784 TaxID=2983231 RepID=UPI0023F99482|nr:TRIC cation channel family protein [Bifidobacterium sp. ESL0784]MDF7641585.1 TRIC cation channel family protein [Bifidobacterium sp. ESL0784]
MQLALESNVFFWAIEYIATFCCGLLGGLCAVKKKYDFIAILMTVWLTGLGGGIIRDVLLGIFPPVGVSDKGLIITSLLASVTVAIIYPEVDRLKWIMVALDALALGLYAVNGTQKALIYHTSGMTAVFMGLITAIGGGLIRDILINDVPSVIRDSHWYAVPALIGSVLTVFVTRAYQGGHIPFSLEVTFDIAIVAFVVILRVLSVRFDWKVPGAIRRHHTYLPLPVKNDEDEKTDNR